MCVHAHPGRTLFCVDLTGARLMQCVCVHMCVCVCVCVFVCSWGPAAVPNKTLQIVKKKLETTKYMLSVRVTHTHTHKHMSPTTPDLVVAELPVSSAYRMLQNARGPKT